MALVRMLLDDVLTISKAQVGCCEAREFRVEGRLSKISWTDHFLRRWSEFVSVVLLRMVVLGMPYFTIIQIRTHCRRRGRQESRQGIKTKLLFLLAST